MSEESKQIVLSEYAEKAYLTYAMSVIKGRALPSLSDGQKPVQRRILFAMHEMGLVPNNKPVKSARVVGDVIGKYHPHGDASSYEAMVRLAQEFIMRYPLVEGIGNYGSRDGDNAAAMRYTEARLTPFAEILLKEIHMGTVDFAPNYDGNDQEPVDLPSRLPMVLLNGASGIAVGLSTEIPSHNLGEITDAATALLKNPNLTTKALLQYVLGPDFATGGQIINSQQEILQMYEEGRGSLRVRARYHIEKLANRHWQIVVEEIPQYASTKKILSQVEDLLNPKIKPGKKQLSEEQNNRKALFSSLLYRIRDEADQNSPVRLVFEPKSRRQDPTELMNTLMAETDLELTVSVHLIMIGLNGLPQQKSLKTILTEWLQFRAQSVERRLKTRLKAVENRLHLLAGRMTAYLHIDQVIALIRESDEPKKSLITQFSLSELQAEDILEIRLRQLAKLEWIKLEEEQNKLQKEESQLKHLLQDKKQRDLLIIQELEEDKEKFNDKRRTLIQEAARAELNQSAPDQAITVILSKQGWIRKRVGHNLNLSNFSFKEGDELQAVIETRSIAPILLISSSGQVYTVDSTDIRSGRNDGIPLSSLIALPAEANIVGMLSSDGPEDTVFFASSAGYGFLSPLDQLKSHTKHGRSVIDIGKGKEALPPITFNKQDLESLNTVLISEEVRLLSFPLKELNFLKKGKGLQLMKLPPGGRLRFASITKGDNFTLRFQSNSHNRKEVYPLAHILGRRAGKGKPYKTNEQISGLEVAP